MPDSLAKPRSGVRIFHRVVLIAGFGALAILVWKLDVRAVLSIAGRVGWGFVPVIAQGVVPLALNACGWRLSFAPGDARSYPLRKLGALWLAMDGVNYLVPTGSVGGEVARATLLGGPHPAEVRAASVVISRAAQTIAQLTCVLSGFVFLLARVPAIRERSWVIMTAAVLLGLVVTTFAVYLLLAKRLLPSEDPASSVPPASDRWLRRVPRQLRLTLGNHPGQLAAAVGLFAAAYTWTALEAWWICRCIGIPVSLLTALTIEALSVAFDGVIYVVPARIGVQELGKTAIFSLLGLSASYGFAFGIVRHIRELVWAAAGFLIYTKIRKAPA